MIRHVAVLATLTIACSGQINGSSNGDDSSPDAGSGFDPGQVDGGEGDPLDTLQDPLSALNSIKSGADQWAALCARHNTDAVSTAFCAGNAPPTVTNLAQLQALVGLAFQAGNTQNGRNGNPAFVLTGHSSSLVTRFTSAINPRAIIFTPPKSTGRVNNPQPLASFVAMGFVRGEQFAELVSNDANGDLKFFLFRFNQACNANPNGCTVDDLLTPKVEANYTGYSIYEDVDIKNTIFDCLQCHQAGGPNTAKTLRMQELQNPWGHFFRNNRANGQALLADYAAAHATTEAYAGIPGAAITNSDPAQLEGLVENQGFKAQPNEFSTQNILDKGRSTAWVNLYTMSETGVTIPPPYHENRVSDPTLLATATTAYKDAMTNGTPLLVDTRSVFADAALRDMSFRPSQDLVTAGNGLGVLTQMCQQCHNPTLDQTQSRAKFDVTKLSSMSRDEKDLAIKRLTLPGEPFRRMPPPRFRELDATEINLVTQELMK